MCFFRGGTLDPPSRCTENREWRWRSAMMANGWRVPPWSSLRSGQLLPQTFFGTPKTEWSITVFPHWDPNLGKMYQFQTNPNSIKWILQLASQIWQLSQHVGYVLFYATPAGRICPRGWRSWSKPHGTVNHATHNIPSNGRGMRTSWTWRVWAETIQARFKLYIIIWFNNVL